MPKASNYASSDALHAARIKERERYYTQKYQPRAWTVEEEEVLLNWTGTDRELSKVLQRNIKSIQHKRARLRHTEK